MSCSSAGSESNTCDTHSSSHCCMVQSFANVRRGLTQWPSVPRDCERSLVTTRLSSVQYETAAAHGDVTSYNQQLTIRLSTTQYSSKHSSWLTASCDQKHRLQAKNWQWKPESIGKHIPSLSLWRQWWQNNSLRWKGTNGFQKTTTDEKQLVLNRDQVTQTVRLSGWLWTVNDSVINIRCVH